MPKDCSPDLNKANQEAAIAEGTPDYHHDIVVTIREVSGEKITFTASGPNPKAEHTARWGHRDQMWPACPSTLPSGATRDKAGAPPERDAEGTLYLSASYVKAELEAGREIFASDPKWPRSAGVPPRYGEVRFRITSMVVSGVELDSGEFRSGTLELMHPDIASPEQSITVSATSKSVTLNLAEETILGLGISFERLHDLQRAVDIITAAPRDPGDLAWAWRVVATAQRHAARERDSGRSDGQHEALLARVLSDPAR